MCYEINTNTENGGVNNYTPTNYEKRMQIYDTSKINQIPMNTKLIKVSPGRRKRSRFKLETRALQWQHQDILPKHVEPIAIEMNNHPCQDNVRNGIVETTVPNITKKDEQSNNVKKTLTISMLEEKCTQETWIIIYTNGPSTNATKDGGTCIYIRYHKTTKLKKKPLLLQIT